jgi:hypothetical protein
LFLFVFPTYSSVGCDFYGQVKRLYDAFHEPFRRTTKQLRLDNAVVKVGQDANTGSNTPVDSSTIPVEATETLAGYSETNADKPEPSVRRALDAAYAKVAKRKASSRTETSMKDMSTDNRQTPPVNIEVIDIT